MSGDDATGWRRTPLPPPAVATRRHSAEDAIEHVAIESDLVDAASYSYAEFKREYDPIVRQMADNEVIEIEDDDEKTVLEWLQTDAAKHPGCWLSNTYED